MKMNVHDLEDLSTPEFNDELSQEFRNLDDFWVFLEPTIVRRTAEYLTLLRDTVDGQLLAHGGVKPGEPDWGLRTKGFRGLVTSRLHMAQGRIRTAEAKDGGTNTGRQWKRTLHRLVELLLVDERDGGEWPELDDILTPFGDISLRDWVERRLEKDPTRTGVNA